MRLSKLRPFPGIRLLAGPALALVLLAGCRPSPQGPPSPAGPAAASPAAASGAPGLQKVGTFKKPIFVASPPGDARLFVVEKGGRVVQLSGGKARTPAYLDISGSVSSRYEQGLFSIAFAPDYATSGLAYVSYTNRDGNTRVDEYRVNAGGDRLDPTTRREILAVEQPFANHNGGLIAFDPSGMLLIGLGDGGGAGDTGNRAQNLGTLLGKFVRIDPRKPSPGKPYGIPPDNPFLKTPGALPEIWAYGLRNPWRWSFDPATKDLYVADVGQEQVEEVSVVPPGGQAGANYGWRRYEGTKVYSPDKIDESKLVVPVLEYSNDKQTCSITGGGVYRGSVEALKGYYLYGDFCQGTIKAFKMSNGRVGDEKTFEQMKVANLASFGEDSGGQMYAVSLNGPVYRIVSG